VGTRFLGQPFGEEDQIGTVLREALADEAFERFWLAAAWAKRSGLNRIRNAVSAFVERGGGAEAIVGIDEGGATKEGLEACLDLFTRTWVLKDRGGRTFHPKLYAVENDALARVIVGSGNLTRGGMFTNYEASLCLDLHRDSAEEWAVRDSVRAYFEELLGSAAVLRLDQELIDRLVDEGWVVSEAQSNRRRARASGTRRGADLFTTVAGLAGAPPAEGAELEEEAADEDSSLETSAGSTGNEEEEVTDAPEEEEEGEEPGEEPGTAAGGTLGFWKALSASDASHTSSPGQIIIPRRFVDFFPPMNIEIDETATGGPRQSSIHFELDFTDGGWRKRVTDARVVLYEPAAYHPRPNIELRFTFRDRNVFDRLQADDILVFSRSNGSISVERRPPGSLGAGARFGSLP
jgi:hypothetical protein